jgi:hypothetical protein
MIVVEIDALVIHCSTVNELIWVHHEFPWIGYGFIHLVHESAGSIVRTRLRELSCPAMESSSPALIGSEGGRSSRGHLAMVDLLGAAARQEAAVSQRKNSRSTVINAQILA